MSGPLRGADLSAFASELATAWLRDAPQVRHRRLTGTLVSADLSGFTAMSERLAVRGREGAERLTLLVNGCFTAIIDAAAQEGGDVLKFGGDALLIWFHGDDHAVRACRAGARMQLAIHAARFVRSGLRMSVGAHTGTFDAFLVGRPDWRELVLAGRGVTTTVELEAAADATQVYVSPATASAVPQSWCGDRIGGAVPLSLGAIPLPRRRSTVLQPPQDGGADDDVADARAALVPPLLRASVAALADTGGEHRLATAVFVELEGTDAALEAAGGAAFVSGIDDLVRAAQDSSERFGVQFLYTDVIADGIKLICTAGAPTSTGEDEEAGLRFATELVSGDPQGNLRAGVHRGRMFAGFLGSPDRRTYTVMGDPVNLAARLMGRAEPAQVIASDEVLSRSRAAFVRTSLPPFLVKGKAEPVVAHVVGPPTGQQRARASVSLPLLGREPELAVLREAIGAAADGVGAVVEIVGDAGIGKTRLLEAVADDPRLLLRVTSECQPYDGLSPFASVRPLLRRALGIPVDASPAVAGRRLRSVTARVAPSVAPMLPLVALAVGAEVPDTPEASAVAEEFRTAQLHDAVNALLSGALSSTSLLVVEDVYYVDDASLRLLQALAATVPQRPWVLAVTRRPEGPGLVVGTVAGTLVKLQPLEGEVAVRLAEVAAGQRSIGALDLGVMAERSGGNPLFVLELVEAAGAGVATADLPESIERLVATRVDRLEPADRALLRLAAVIGRVFHTSLLNHLLAAEGAPLIAADRWEHLADLIEPEGDRRWRFRHALFRDVAYEGLPFARRKRMHSAVGELIEAGVAGEPDVALLSQHFWLAGDAERTWRYSVAAGDVAWASFAVAEAIAAYRRALGARRRLKSLDPLALSQVAETLGDVLERAARYDEAEEAYRLAQRGAGGHDPAAHSATLMRKLGVLRERIGQYEQALHWYRRGRARLRGLMEPAALGSDAALLVASAGVMHRLGRHEEIVRLGQQAIPLAVEASDMATEAHACLLVQVGLSHSGHVADQSYGKRALMLFEELDNVLYQGKVLNNLGIDHYFAGRWDDAAASYLGAVDRFRAAGDVVEAATATNNLGEILSDQGHLTEAVGSFERALAAWRQAGYPLGCALAQANLGRVYARSGRRTEARSLLLQALAQFRLIGSAAFATEVLLRLAEAHVFSDESEAGLADVDRLLEGLDPSVAFPGTASSLHRIRGWSMLQEGHTNSAISDFRIARTLAEEDRARYESLLALDALVFAGAGDLQDQLDVEMATLGVAQLPRVPLPI